MVLLNVGSDAECVKTVCAAAPFLGLGKPREAAGLTQERLAFRAGFSRPSISQVERN